MPPKVNEDECIGCGQCADVCPADPCVFEVVDEKAKVNNPDACIECGACEATCPTSAIEL